MTRRNSFAFSLIVISLLVAALTSTSCASLPGHIPPGSSTAIVIELARAGVRVGLQVELQKRGVSAEDSAAILAELHQVGNQVLAGKDVRAILADPTVWNPLRADLAKRLGAIIAKAKVRGVPVYDQATAEAFAGALLDAFASAFGAHAAT